ncbi:MULTISPECIES: glycosyltransferase family 2 protein [Pseudomonadales]|jgi:glycosyltransferase involved in cell wall biosynthesis|uniref:Glycosyltransferase involved in cell wall bisynthesis n=2 Tax=Halopseudomonas TaxID=2901189 RepID=A0A031M4X5_9GAMM|nr:MULTISPECIES: glycosyltransferase family 2 protein [Pseudomonadales]EZQ15652.1 glycosyl transferase family 2 [Halopseudomonas bauzanensis]MCK7553352.1 glycosyltransferase family 2 protein [Marinobacter goseongensis]SER33627.1 Glycosyltransferase involved in cell wall bisynthesis [Halopseudomonas bauzanensis]SFL82132.1 Glycosyltransferase involved in cell wall bisynthesis [Halopseudomonas bauzanensis]SFQ85832.1 Glycosyltransferase involved in cell wall bisynthesis [Halopseudomonas formosensi
MNKSLDFHLEPPDDRLISLVVPVYNERVMLPLFFDRVLPVLAAVNLRHEIVFVDDGSEDGSAVYIRNEIKRTPGLRLVKLSRNFGKEAAVTAGLEHARGDAVIVLDADLQDPPEQIPAMIESWQSGADVVLMQRRSRAGETAFKRWSAHLFYRLLNRTSRTDIPVDTGDFRLMSRKAVDAILTLNERNRYMKGLFAWIGLPTRVIQYDREPRAAGETKWDYPGLVGLALEGLTSFSVSPLRWATVIGLFAASVGALFGLWIVIKAMMLGDATSGYPSLVAIISFLGGIQLLSIGIVGEYVGKTYLETKQRPVYLAEEVLESPVGVSQPLNTRLAEASHVKAI